MGNTYGSSFKEFLSEKKGRKKKRTKRKYAPGGGPAVGQGGIGGNIGGASGGESFIPTDGSFLREIAAAPYSPQGAHGAATPGMSSVVLAYTQAATHPDEQVDEKECPRCGDLMHSEDRYCARCGEMHPSARVASRYNSMDGIGYEQQEDEVDDEEEPEDQIEQDNEEEPDQGELDDEEEVGPEEEPEEPQDPDKQGIIRTVDDAHLVYKRQTPDGDYEELWIYNIDTDLKNELEIRRNILAGTDIPQGKTRSDDGSQSYDLVTLGNAQLLHVKGLQN